MTAGVPRVYSSLELGHIGLISIIIGLAIYSSVCNFCNQCRDNLARVIGLSADIKAAARWPDVSRASTGDAPVNVVATRGGHTFKYRAYTKPPNRLHPPPGYLTRNYCLTPCHCVASFLRFAENWPVDKDSARIGE